jgi:hypothetical protein
MDSDMPSAVDHIRARARNTKTKLTVVAARIVDGQLDLADLAEFASNPPSTKSSRSVKRRRRPMPRTRECDSRSIRQQARCRRVDVER